MVEFCFFKAETLLTILPSRILFWKVFKDSVELFQDHFWTVASWGKILKYQKYINIKKAFLPWKFMSRKVIITRICNSLKRISRSSRIFSRFRKVSLEHRGNRSRLSSTENKCESKCSKNISEMLGIKDKSPVNHPRSKFWQLH